MIVSAVQVKVFAADLQSQFITEETIAGIVNTEQDQVDTTLYTRTFTVGLKT